MNRLVFAAVTATLLMPALPAAAETRKQYRERQRYENSQAAYDQCRRDKRRAGNRGTAIGAVGGGAGTAILGGGLGGSLLGAGVGAVAGNAIGRGGVKC